MGNRKKQNRTLKILHWVIAALSVSVLMAAAIEAGPTWAAAFWTTAATFVVYEVLKERRT